MNNITPKDAMELEVGIIGKLRKEAKSKVITRAPYTLIE